jgi:tetratricopeptide (TPR) repeat protein
MRVIDGTSGVVLWSSRVAGDRERIFDLEERLAGDLSEFLAIPVTPGERRRLTRDPTRSILAYDYFLKGQRHLEQRPQSPEFAIENFRQAIRLDDEFAFAWVGLSQALQTRYDERDRSTETLAEAESAAARALELDPDLPEALVNFAQLERATGHTEASLARLEEALSRHPKPDEAYRQLAYTQRQAGDLRAARESMEAAVALGPERWSNWNTLGSILVDLGDYEEARSAFANAAERAPEGFTWPEENLAAIELYSGNFDQAVEAYERIRAPVDADLASNRGTAYYYVGRYDDAAEFYRLAVELGPRDHVNRRNLADLLLLLGSGDAAREQYREALRLVREERGDRPGDIELRLAEVFYLARASDCDEALVSADVLAQTMPPSAENSHDLALAYAVCGAPDRALGHLEHAIREGYSLPLVEEESEFDAVRDEPRYRALAEASRGS